METPNWLDRHGLGCLNLLAYCFVWHKKEETEQVANVKPAKFNELNDLWPRPWLWSRALILFAISFFVLYFCWKEEGMEEQSRLYPGLIIMGSLATPVSILIYFFELNKFRTVSLLKVLRYFLIGSIVSIGVTFLLTYINMHLDTLLEFFIGLSGTRISHVSIDKWHDAINAYIPTYLAALFEEFGKTLIIFIFLMHYRRRIYILQGILIGASVGAGFSVFESAGYTLLDSDNLLNTVMSRGIFAPVCHIAWGALIGGGTMMITSGRLKVTKLLNPKFSAMFLFVSLLHGVWNYVLRYPNASLLRFARINFHLNTLQLSLITLFLVFLMIWAGKRQITKFKNQGYLPVEI